MIGKLISLLSLGGTFASVTMLQQFLAGLIAVIALTIVSSVMAAILLSCCFYGFYVALTRFGVTPDMALLSTAMLVLCVTIVSGWLAVAKLRHLKELPFKGIQNDMPSLSKVSSVASAFFEGLTTGSNLKTGTSIAPANVRRLYR